MKGSASLEKHSNFFKHGHSVNSSIKMTQKATSVKLCLMLSFGAAMNEYEPDVIIRTKSYFYWTRVISSF